MVEYKPPLSVVKRLQKCAKNIEKFESKKAWYSRRKNPIKSNSWITFVKKLSKEQGISYKKALVEASKIYKK